MCVRGTDFIVEVDEDGNTAVFLSEGVLNVKSKYNNTSIILRPGEKVCVPKDTAMQPQKTMSLTEKKIFSVETRENLLLQTILHWVKLVSKLN
jgi:hypothetical protein